MRLASILTAVLIAAAACLLAAPADADPAQTQVGSQRAVFARSGTPLTEQPRALSKAVKVLPYGTRVKIEEVRGAWARVTEYQGTTAGATGWLRLNKTAEPFALSQGGQLSTRRTARGTGRVSQRDVVAAGRQFDESSESKHKQASSAALKLAYKQLDELVEAIKPTLEEIKAFVAEGRLGRPGGRRTKPAGS
ncbi:MAG: SH3 domain-containing protein [Planctomycetota bacterium]|nr:SH3 domain-containing protein [Planctomycetota bacterium]